MANSDRPLLYLLIIDIAVILGLEPPRVSLHDDLNSLEFPCTDSVICSNAFYDLIDITIHATTLNRHTYLSALPMSVPTISFDFCDWYIAWSIGIFKQGEAYWHYRHENITLCLVLMTNGYQKQHIHCTQFLFFGMCG